MNPDELWETTLNKENNSLLKVTYSNLIDNSKLNNSAYKKNHLDNNVSNKLKVGNLGEPL